MLAKLVCVYVSNCTSHTFDDYAKHVYTPHTIGLARICRLCRGVADDVHWPYTYLSMGIIDLMTAWRGVYVKRRLIGTGQAPACCRLRYKQTRRGG
jgi:hypothetical protein